MPLEENGGYLKTRDGYRVVIDHLGEQMTHNKSKESKTINDLLVKEPEMSNARDTLFHLFISFNC